MVNVPARCGEGRPDVAKQYILCKLMLRSDSSNNGRWRTFDMLGTVVDVWSTSFDTWEEVEELQGEGAQGAILLDVEATPRVLSVLVSER